MGQKPLVFDEGFDEMQARLRTLRVDREACRVIPSQEAARAWGLAASLFERLQPEERVAVVTMIRLRWCPSCGHDQPAQGRMCQCENDE